MRPHRFDLTGDTLVPGDHAEALVKRTALRVSERLRALKWEQLVLICTARGPDWGPHRLGVV